MPPFQKDILFTYASREYRNVAPEKLKTFRATRIAYLLQNLLCAYYEIALTIQYNAAPNRDIIDRFATIVAVEDRTQSENDTFVNLPAKWLTNDPLLNLGDESKAIGLLSENSGIMHAPRTGFIGTHMPTFLEFMYGVVKDSRRHKENNFERNLMGLLIMFLSSKWSDNDRAKPPPAIPFADLKDSFFNTFFTLSSKYSFDQKMFQLVDSITPSDEDFPPLEQPQMMTRSKTKEAVLATPDGNDAGFEDRVMAKLSKLYNTDSDIQKIESAIVQGIARHFVNRGELGFFTPAVAKIFPHQITQQRLYTAMGGNGTVRGGFVYAMGPLAHGIEPGGPQKTPSAPPLERLLSPPKTKSTAPPVPASRPTSPDSQPLISPPISTSETTAQPGLFSRLASGVANLLSPTASTNPPSTSTKKKSITAAPLSEDLTEEEYTRQLGLNLIHAYVELKHATSFVSTSDDFKYDLESDFRKTRLADNPPFPDSPEENGEPMRYVNLPASWALTDGNEHSLVKFDEDPMRWESDTVGRRRFTFTRWPDTLDAFVNGVFDDIQRAMVKPDVTFKHHSNTTDNPEDEPTLSSNLYGYLRVLFNPSNTQPHFKQLREKYSKAGMIMSLAKSTKTGADSSSITDAGFADVIQALNPYNVENQEFHDKVFAWIDKKRSLIDQTMKDLEAQMGGTFDDPTLNRPVGWPTSPPPSSSSSTFSPTPPPVVNPRDDDTSAGLKAQIANMRNSLITMQANCKDEIKRLNEALKRKQTEVDSALSQLTQEKVKTTDLVTQVTKLHTEVASLNAKLHDEAAGKQTVRTEASVSEKELKAKLGRMTEMATQCRSGRYREDLFFRGNASKDSKDPTKITYKQGDVLFVIQVTADGLIKHSKVFEDWNPTETAEDHQMDHVVLNQYFKFPDVKTESNA